MTSVTLSAPAKLNLGLAVTGKRPDGYHDLITIFQAVSIEDRLTLTPMGPPTHSEDRNATRFSCSDPTLSGTDNLVVRAVDLVRSHTGRADPIAISLDKAIPAASGLGGASSDAAATIMGLDRMWELELSEDVKHGLAMRLGSDVPFFLRGGSAVAMGRGERLRQLRKRTVSWYVVAFPRLTSPIPRKTPSLFAALTPEDLRDGANILAQAALIESGDDLEPRLLGNAFQRPLYELRPELAAFQDAFREAGAPFVALSGAGPSHYTAVSDQARAERIGSAVRRLYSGDATVFICADDTAVDRDD